jgi:putative IMPACT (imprinted ancient) family translation regulator
MTESPLGTAGAPMLELLRKKNLCNVVVIVTRYFGGILLGTGGLVRAYAGATKLALEEATFIEKRNGTKVDLILAYSEIENVKYYCKINDIKITKEEYLDNVNFEIELTKQQLEKLKNEIDNNNLKLTKINKISKKII